MKKRKKCCFAVFFLILLGFTNFKCCFYYCFLCKCCFYIKKYCLLKINLYICCTANLKKTLL